jgi:hypothetical protein
MTKWTLYTFLLGFTVYWISNLFLWFPWSYSPVLGISLMLTVSPIFWAYTIYLALKAYPLSSLWYGVSLLSLIFLLLAIGMDYIFFGVIRQAMNQLYHPTTIYGYIFLALLPSIVLVSVKKQILRNKREVNYPDITRIAIIGLVSFGLMVLIIMME